MSDQLGKGRNGTLKENLKAYSLLFAVFFIWGSIYVAGKYAMGVMSPVAVTGGRYLIAFALMVPIGYKRLKVKIDKEDWKSLLVIGGLGYYLQTIVNMLGVRLIGASTASLINSLNPVSISIIAAVMLRERIKGIHVVCILLSILGTAVITSGAAGGGQIAGILLSLSAIILWGFASVNMRKLSAKYDVMTVTLYGIIISLLFYAPTIAADIISRGGFEITWGAGAAVLYMGVIGTALAGYLWTKALSMMEASFCSMFYPLQTLFSALLGAALLEERFRPTFYIGAAIIAASVVINCINRDKAAKAHTAMR